MVSLACGLLLSTIASITRAETVTRTTNITVDGSELNQGGSTAIVTYKGVIYHSWIDSTTLKIMKLHADGRHTTTIIRENIRDDIHHVMPSIGIDRDGYIHVTADEHNADWVYYISDAPEDISSFSRIEHGTSRCPPGDDVTYPEFFRAPDSTLYLAFRFTYHEPTKNHSGALARYDADTRSWSMLGGTAHDRTTTMIWDSTGGHGGWYQQPRVRLAFSDGGRIHLSAAVISEYHASSGWNVHTHVIYAYSDDRGDTWYRVTGEGISSLPLTVDNATVVVDRSSEQDIWGGTRVAAYSPSRPVVCYMTADGSTALNWNGEQWTPVTAPWTTAGCYGRPNGEVCFFRPYVGMCITRDSGQTWVTYQQQSNTYHGGSEKVDAYFYAETGDFRWQSSTDNNTTITVYTYELASGVARQESWRPYLSSFAGVPRVRISMGPHGRSGPASQAYVVGRHGSTFSLQGRQAPQIPAGVLRNMRP